MSRRETVSGSDLSVTVRKLLLLRCLRRLLLPPVCQSLYSQPVWMMSLSKFWTVRQGTSSPLSVNLPPDISVYLLNILNVNVLQCFAYFYWVFLLYGWFVSISKKFPKTSLVRYICITNPLLYLMIYMLPIIPQIIVCPLWHLHLLKMALLMGYCRALGV